MESLQDFFRSKNPKKEDQALLLYNSKYHLWKDGEYLGIATWTKDENVGDSFQSSFFDKEEGSIVQRVYEADKWELVIDKNR
jgi:hypothetical protein